MLSGRVFRCSNRENNWVPACALTCFMYEQIHLTEGSNYVRVPPADNQVFGPNFIHVVDKKQIKHQFIRSICNKAQL